MINVVNSSNNKFPISAEFNPSRAGIHAILIIVIAIEMLPSIMAPNLFTINMPVKRDNISPIM